MGPVQLNKGQLNKINQNKILFFAVVVFVCYFLFVCFWLVFFCISGMRKKIFWPQKREVRFLVKIHFKSDWICKCKERFRGMIWLQSISCLLRVSSTFIGFLRSDLGLYWSAQMTDGLMSRRHTLQPSANGVTGVHTNSLRWTQNRLKFSCVVDLIVKAMIDKWR